MAELKKCPFCGGEAELNYYGSESMPFYSVSCKECGCNQDTSIHKEAVIEAWNKRVNEFDSEKYEKLVLTEMERKHSENQQLLSELKAVLPTTTESEIRASAIDEFAEKLKADLLEMHWINIGSRCTFERMINEIAEQLKEE